MPLPRPLSEWRGEWILLFASEGKPHPRPLSEWRGEWILLVGWERVVRGDRGNCILKLRKSPSRLQKGVSLQWKGRLFDVKKRPLYLQTMVFTPLSIRRGVGGEAFLHLQTIVFTPLSIRRGVGGEAVVGLVVRLLVESKKGVSFCVFPCSFRNSVSLSGSVPFVYSVLKMP